MRDFTPRMVIVKRCLHLLLVLIAVAGCAGTRSARLASSRQPAQALPERKPASVSRDANEFEQHGRESNSIASRSRSASAPRRKSDLETGVVQVAAQDVDQAQSGQNDSTAGDADQAQTEPGNASELTASVVVAQSVDAPQEDGAELPRGDAIFSKSWQHPFSGEFCKIRMSH